MKDAHPSLYLGIDASTQQLTLQALEVQGGAPRLVFEHVVAFDRDLPEYGTRHGVLPSDDPRVAVVPPLLWADALDRALGAFVRSGLDRSQLAAISGAAQQHGSVYLAGPVSTRLENLDPARPLAAQIVGIGAREVAPIWLDTSTSAECEEISKALGGPVAVARLTGSRVFERFTAAQIRRFARVDPRGYAHTHRIHLVSSFLCSLLLGADAPVDPGDASGTNLMDLVRRSWAAPAVEATVPGLAARLPAIVPSSTVVGSLSAYWRQRYDLPAARLVVWTGDNPSSLIGTGLVEEGRVAISLGTSDTIFGLMRTARIDTHGLGHVFGAPTGDLMGLTVFSNGSLAREKVRDAYGLDWPGFSVALETTTPGNGGGLMLPWFVPEITPRVRHPGVRRSELDPLDAARNVRAVVEAQMMAMANHSQWMGVAIRAIQATGGAAVNRAILQVMADVFGAEVSLSRVGNSACLGAALRAWHADAKTRGESLSWLEIVRGFAPDPSTRISPTAAHTRVYAGLRERYARLEHRALESD